MAEPGSRDPKPDAADPTDGELVRAAQDGAVRAFEALLERHEASVLRVLRLLGIRAADREDVAQDVFIKVFRHLGSVDARRPFRSWLYRVTLNAANDHRARLARDARVSEGGGAPDEMPDRRPGPESIAGGADLARALERALEALTDRERAVFVLRELEGLETKEVARALGVTSITVRRHHGLARKRIRKWLERS